MWELFGEKGEKKVEYIELIYDLIFVYLLGRSNELLFHMQGGFFTFQTYVTFLYSTLVILQVLVQVLFTMIQQLRNVIVTLKLMTKSLV